MSDPTMGPGEGGGPPPSEEELRAAYEAELERVTVPEMMLQATVSLLNLAARRLGPPGAGEGAPGRDLTQARDAIDGVRALLSIIERGIGAEQTRALRDALSQLQMAYAAEVRESGGGEPGGVGGEGGGGTPPPSGGQPGGAEDKGGPGPAESSGRLWVPGR